MKKKTNKNQNKKKIHSPASSYTLIPPGRKIYFRKNLVDEMMMMTYRQGVNWKKGQTFR
jgi:hypothetical protein